MACSEASGWPLAHHPTMHACVAANPCPGDAFGLHYCTEDPFDSELKPLEPHYQ